MRVGYRLRYGQSQWVIILRYLLLCFGLVGVPHNAAAADTDTHGSTKQGKQRPTVGLVLGGGSARGIAHVGVIKALEDARIPIDVIAGSSMGSVVGSLYAAGYPADDIADIAVSLDWASLFDDKTARAAKIFRRKSDDFGFLNGYQLTFKNGGLVLPTGVIQGQSLFLELSTLLADARGIQDFDALPIPFHPVSMDINTGEEVVLTQGDLATAVFASMSLPGLLPPVSFSDHTLIDGGFVNNLPISIARDMGADIIIVVSVGSNSQSPDNIASFAGVLRQTQKLMMKSNIDKQMATLTGDDIVIKPELTGYTFASFDAAPTMIDRGEAAVATNMPRLEHLQLSEADWAIHKAGQRAAEKQARVISKITIDQDSSISDQLLLRNLRIKTGDTLDTVELGEDIDKIYAIGIFDRINYTVNPISSGNELTITARTRVSDRGFFRFGVSLDSNLENKTDFQLGLSYTKPQINARAGELRFQANAGNVIQLKAEYYQPFGYGQQYFFEPSVQITRERDEFVDDDNRLRGETRSVASVTSLAAGLLFGTWGEWRIGVGTRSYNFEFTDSDLSGNAIKVRDSTVFTQFTIDTLDTLNFPRNGSYVNVRFEHHDKFLSGELKYNSAQVLAVKPISWRSNTLAMVLNGAATKGDNTLSNASLGGFLSLSGFANDEVAGNYSLLASSVYYRRLNRRAILFDTPLFVGGSLELGNAFDKTEDIRTDNLITAGSVFAGMSSPLGPVYFGYGRNSKHKAQWYFSVGQFF